MSLDELLSYDTEGIVPFRHESEKTFKQRATKIREERKQFTDFLHEEKYPSETCERSAEQFLQQQTSFPEEWYAVHREKQEQKSFFCWPYYRSFGERSMVKPWTWPLMWLVPLAGAVEYIIDGSWAMGFLGGYVAYKIGLHTYRYCKTAYLSSAYHKERKAIAAKEGKAIDLITNSYPNHTKYLIDRLEHEDWKKIISCEKREDLQKTIEQLSGVKGKIIRERLRRDGYVCAESTGNLLNKIPTNGIKKLAEYLALLFCSVALFFESGFGYRDYMYDNKRFGEAVQENKRSCAKELEEENHITGSLPTITTGYRALHHSLWQEVQNTIEEILPVCSLPGIKQILMIYTYMGSGLIACTPVNGHYSPSRQEIAIIPDKKGVSFSAEDKYVLLHELGHHYVHLTNPSLSKRTLAKSTIANSVFHEGLAEYLSINTTKTGGIMSHSLEQYHRCMYLIAGASQFVGYENPYLSKVMHYSIGFSFVDYALSELGQEQLRTIIQHPPEIEDFMSPEKYILGLKQKIGKKPIIEHPEKNPIWTIRKYLEQR